MRGPSALRWVCGGLMLLAAAASSAKSPSSETSGAGCLEIAVALSVDGTITVPYDTLGFTYLTSSAVRGWLQPGTCAEKPGAEPSATHELSAAPEGIRITARDLVSSPSSTSLAPGTYLFYADPPGPRNSMWRELSVRAPSLLALGLVEDGALVQKGIPAALAAVLRIECRAATSGPWAASLQECVEAIPPGQQPRIWVRVAAKSGKLEALASEPIEVDAPARRAASAPPAARQEASALTPGEKAWSRWELIDGALLFLVSVGIVLSSLLLGGLRKLNRQTVEVRQRLRELEERVKAASSLGERPPSGASPEALARLEQRLEALFNVVTDARDNLLRLRRNVADASAMTAASGAGSLQTAAKGEASRAVPIAAPLGSLSPWPGDPVPGAVVPTDAEIASISEDIYGSETGVDGLEARWRERLRNLEPVPFAMDRGQGELHSVLLADYGRTVLGIPLVFDAAKLHRAKDGEERELFRYSPEAYAMSAEVKALRSPARLSRAGGAWRVEYQGLIELKER